MQWIIGSNLDEIATLVFTEFETKWMFDYVRVYGCLDTSCLSVEWLLAELSGGLDRPYLVTAPTGIVKVVWNSVPRWASGDSATHSGWSATWTTFARA